MSDPGLEFWLRHVEDRGGLWEPAGDSVLVVLPPELSKRYQLAEELTVTGDPDVAREDGVTFLGAGHPVLTEAAEAVLDEGDVGVRLLERPTTGQPADAVLLDHARAQLPVGHGRIDLADPSRPVVRWLLRVGALASYAVSAEDLFQERVERWVDVASRREVPARVVERVTSAPVTPAGGGGHRPATPVDELGPALAEADRLIEAEALRRRTALAGQLGDAYQQERARADSYYADAIAGIERRLATAPPDRRALLEDRLASTREERQRRLAEIAEKHQARHDIRPYLLHLVGVPARRLPVDVRRGERRYPMQLDWLAPVGAFAEPRCPACDATAPLVAGKDGLGCHACKAPAAPTVVAPAVTARPAPKRPKPDPPPPKAAAPKPSTAPKPPKPPKPPKQQRPRAVPPQPQPAAAPKQADKLAAAVWNAVAERRNRRLRDVIGPDSPAAALRRLYGVDGLRYAIGAPPDEELVGFTSGSVRLTGRTGYTGGTVQTDGGDYPYALHWHATGPTLSIVEVLAYPPGNDGLSGFYWMFGGWRRLIHAPVPADVPELDEVARLLVSVGVPLHGLSVTARALAAWWRLDGALLPPEQPAVAAAAVHRLVAGRAGDKGRFREIANAFDVDEPALRRTDAVLRKQLALGPNRAW